MTGRNIIPVTDSSQHSTNGTFSQPTDPTASQDSPPQSSAPAPSQDANDKSKTSTPGPTYSKRVLIVSSTNLEKAKATFDIVDSEHIYALSPNPLKDLRVLAECNRQVTSKYSNEDPLETWSSTYGVIRNENVWRRTRGGMPVSVPAPASKVVNDAPADSKPSLKKAESKREESIDEEPSKDRKTIGTDKEAQPIDNKPAKTTTQKHPPTLKKESSSIMASFAKTRPAAEKKEVEKDKDTAQSDEDLIGDDDDDDENDDGMDIDERTKEQDEAIKKKEEREAKLRDMMDMDDESDTNKEKSKMDENEDVDMPDISQTSQSQQNISQDTVNEQADTNTGRKRGKRRVMKKKTVKDEEGYLGKTFFYHFLSRSNTDVNIKSRKKKQFGNHSPKTRRFNIQLRTAR